MKTIKEIFFYLLISIILFGFYFVTAKLGLSLNAVSGFATFVWPPTGIALAALLIFGFRFAPAIFLAAALVNFSTGASVPTAIGIGLGNMLEPLVGAFLLQRVGFRNSLERLQDVVSLIIYGALISTLVSATIGVTSLFLSGIVKTSAIPGTWTAWWIGDMLGDLLVAPFLLAWSARATIVVNVKRMAELLLAIAVLFFAGFIVFGNIVSVGYPLIYLVYPPLIWIALRFRQRESTTAMLLLATIAIVGTIKGFGPFASPDLSNSLLSLQVFIAVISATTLILSSIISERLSIEETLFLQGQSLKALADNSPDIIARFDRNLRHVYVNSMAEKVTGISPKKYIGKTNKDLNMPEEQEKYWSENIIKVFKTGKEGVIEFDFKVPGGGVHYFQARLVPEFNRNGQIQYVLGVSHDITELKKYQEDLKMQTQELDEIRVKDEAILEDIGDGLIVTDKQGKIVFLNKVAEALLGWDTKEAAGNLLIEIAPMEGEKQETILLKDRPMTLALKTSKKITGSYFYQKRDHTRFPVSITVTPLVVSGVIVGSVEVFRDITREKELARAKDEFISLASHELRTPMTAIKGFISMIIHGDYGPVNKGLERPLAHVNTSTERQIRLINDLLDVSRLQSGRVNYHLANFSLGQTVSEVVASLQPLAQQKSITVTLTEDPDVLVQADVEATKRILSNLLGNAIKFTGEKGSIAISYRKDTLIHVVIVDNGIGIAPEDQDKLFGKFQQLTTHEARKPIGSGLGLFLSRETARTMGGDVWLEKSIPGKGSTFIISLPKTDTPKAQAIREKFDKEITFAFS